MINIISAYAPQVGEKEVNKEELTKDLVCMIDSIPVGEKGSGLSPFLFTIVLYTISEECRNGLPWELLFADDLAIIADSEEELQRRWLKWQIGLESKGLKVKVNTGKTEVMVSGRNRTKVNIKDKEGRELNQVDQFKYLGVTFSKEGEPETAVRARVKAAWQKWRELGPVIADKKIPTKLKTKLYTTVVRPVILYGAECWTTGVKGENILEKTEMRILRRIKGVTLKDKMKGEDIRKELGVGSIKSKARESRLRWFGHVHRREQESNLRQVMDMESPEGDQEAD
ncbi:retrovirus-related Pol polyprotein from type-1 retrotransposable element R2 [Elysia marginata]|uniref:Retrovirus-related Pol polyprotein from type-1 retrotransposable element R2 n=1 Tax=Elysia marginata TaxID=1093978 RepID=A0AAV4JEL3_9GAST|nr:retrovirus-related Pol polyprotein from type-1 retrotransposable element R2 [Elysia marginata]